MSASTTRAALLKKRLDSFTKTLHGVGQGDVSSLHRARVASRRLREILPTLQVKHPAAIQKIAKRLRKVTRRLGIVRELDVLVLLIDELHLERRDRFGAVGRVGVSVAKDRDAARKRLEQHLPVDEMRRVARKVERLTGELTEDDAPDAKHLERSWRWVVEARVARRAAHVLRALDEAGTVYVPERLHAVRIAMKKLRYTAELLAEGAGDGSAASAIRVLRRGQDLLGRMHDLDVLLERVRRVQASLTPPNIAVWRDLDALVISLEDECRRLHARYMRMREAIAAQATAWSGSDKGRGTRAGESRSSKAS